MKDNRLEQRIQHSLNAELSGLNTTSWQRDQFYENATGGTKVKRKISVVAVLIAALMLITITAFALTNGFGILEYHPDQSANQAYVDNIMTLNQTWDGKYFSATIHEAVFDGMKMTFTMSISPKENADPVFVIPRITAISGGKELHTFTTHSNVFMDDGFWVPCMEPDVIYDYDHIGVDVILTDDFVTFNPVEDQVEWAVSFDVLHTDWPIDYTAEDEPMIGEPEWTDSDYEKYEHQFVKAYEEKRVLLNQAAMLSPVADAVPHDPSMEDEMAFPDYLETLLTQDAFTIEEKFAFSFTADPLPVKHEKQSVNFETPNGLLAQVESLSVSVDQIGIKLRITRPDSDQPLQLEDWQGWLIAVLAQGAETSFPESNYGPEEDGSLHLGTLGKELLGMLELELEIMVVGIGSEPYFLDDDLAAVLLHLLGFLFLLVDVLLIVKDLANRRIGLSADFNEVKVELIGHLHGLCDRIDAGIGDVVANETYLRSGNLLVDVQVILVLLSFGTNRPRPGGFRRRGLSCTCGFGAAEVVGLVRHCLKKILLQLMSEQLYTIYVKMF